MTGPHTGWYTLEQDTNLTGEPAVERPLDDVRGGAEFINALLAPTAGHDPATSPTNPGEPT